jgi:hypothetical protein
MTRRTPPQTALDLGRSDRLAKLIRLLGSERDGEVLAAVSAMRRTLQTAGLDLHAIAARITDGDPDVKRDAYTRGYSEGKRDAEANAMTVYAAGGTREWRDVAEFCATRAHAPKQQEWLRSIRDRLRRARS